MSTKPKFDPYFEWLGIPPADQPPSLYRLLGLPPFASDTNAIRAASMQLTSHVRKFCLGQHGEEANRILGELAGAMTCLLATERKAAYDVELRAGEAPAEEPPAPPPIQVKAAAPTLRDPKPTFATERPPSAKARPLNRLQQTPELPPLPPLSGSQMLPMLRRPKRANPVTWQLIAAGGGAAVLVLGLLLFRGLGQSDEATAKIYPPQQNDKLPAFPLQKPAARRTSPPAPLSTPTVPTPPIASSPLAEPPLASQTSPAPATPPLAPPRPAPPPAHAPFSASEARAHQETWAAYLGVPVEYENSIGMKFVLIPPGEFLVGSTAAEIEEALVVAGADEYWKELIRSEAPQHKVMLTRPVYLGVYEVTQAEYEKVMGQNPSRFATTGVLKDRVVGLDTSTHPVEQVSWNDAAAFCAKLSQQERFKPFYFRAGETVVPPDGTGYRLPTEAEWEFASRGGTTTRYWIGDNDEDLAQAGWFASNSGGHTHAVGELKANPFGLFDIHGNIWEWVHDWWEPKYYGQFQEKPAIDPSGPAFAGSQHVIRGGDCYFYASACRSSSRHARGPSYRHYGIGFRVALVADAVSLASTERKTLPTPTKVAWQNWPADAPPPAVAPFSTEQAKQHQQAWAGHLDVPLEYQNSIGMKFVLIPPGEFEMGATPAEVQAAIVIAGKDEYWKNEIRSEAPQHHVVLTRPVYLGVNEVTQSQYRKVMGKNPSRFARTGGRKDAVSRLDTSNYPVEFVSWNEAAEFCAKLSKNEKLKPFYVRSGEAVTMLEGTGYRLPTEAEWEFACRAGTTTKYWSGDSDELLFPAVRFMSNSGGRVHAVGELSANPFGLYDINGNVWEWVQDWWHGNYYMQSQGRIAIDPSGPSVGSHRAVRGGGWSFVACYCRASTRIYAAPTDRRDYHGFRVALVLEGSDANR